MNTYHRAFLALVLSQSLAFSQSVIDPTPFQYQDTTKYVTLDSRTQGVGGLKWITNLWASTLSIPPSGSISFPSNYTWTNALWITRPVSNYIASLISSNLSVDKLGSSSISGTNLLLYGPSTNLDTFYFTNVSIGYNLYAGEQAYAMRVINNHPTDTHKRGVPAKAISMGITNFTTPGEIILSNRWFFGIPLEDITAGSRGKVAIQGIVEALIYPGHSITNGQPVVVWCYSAFSQIGISCIASNSILRMEEAQIGIALEDGVSGAPDYTNRVKILLKK